MRSMERGARYEACPGHRSGVRGTKSPHPPFTKGGHGGIWRAGCGVRYLARLAVGVGQIVLVLGLLSLSSLNGWSAEPPDAGGHDHHEMMMHDQMMMPHSKSMKQGPQLETPKGWRFTIPPGDPHVGRQVFAEFECFKCHTVAGEAFSAPKAEQGDVGPALSGMGAVHPAEYFAEVIIDPNASVAWRIKTHKAERKGFLGPDGKSKMPSFNETITVQQLIDLVAYMKSLTTGEHKH